MDSSFNPTHMRPLATMNSRAVMLLPGVDADWVGQTGAQLLSKTALIGLIAVHAGELGLEGEGQADTSPEQYPRRLNELLASNDTLPDRKRLAAHIAHVFGHRLGYLIASIVLSPNGLTDPMDPWEAAYLRWWREEVRQIVLGGGHSTGRLGVEIAQAVEQALADCGLVGWRARAAENPSFLPLIGAARCLPETSRLAESAIPAAAVVADFGGTRAKSGVAFYDDQGRLERLLALPPRDFSALTTARESVPALAAAMVAVLADGMEAARQSGYAPDLRILCSLGAYVEDGQPLDTKRGCYNLLHDLSPDVKGWFSREASRACGRAVSVEFGHDIDLAARTYAGLEKAAVIMLGSHIGVGFVPPAQGYRELTEGFRVVNQ